MRVPLYVPAAGCLVGIGYFIGTATAPGPARGSSPTPVEQSAEYQSLRARLVSEVAERGKLERLLAEIESAR